MIGTDGGHVRLMVRTTALITLILVTSGCSQKQTANEALDQALKASGQIRKDIAKFAGTVTIDGRPPEFDKSKVLVVMLYDPQKPPSPGKVPPLAARCGKNGNFAFNTYETDDGVPVGKYVLLFGVFGTSMRGFVGPDGLKNLYNDPDKNRENPDFNLDIAPPGKVDWAFNLDFETKEPVKTPGPNSITAIKVAR